MSFFKRTYRQALWRTRRQAVGAFLVGLVTISMVGALYLSVTSQAAILGREISDLEANISLVKQTNAQLKTDLAELLSSRNVAERSRALKFHMATVGETYFMPVPGYSEASAIQLTGHKDTGNNGTGLPSAYDQSLFDWLSEYVLGGR
jgi:cell division protein FtsB